MRCRRSAAEQGLVSAQYILGAYLAKDEILPQDYVEAYKWLDLAASRFMSSETRARDYVIALRDQLAAERMTPDQIAEA
jgi:TPR repeat protein